MSPAENIESESKPATNEATRVGSADELQLLQQAEAALETLQRMGQPQGFELPELEVTDEIIAPPTNRSEPLLAASSHEPTDQVQLDLRIEMGRTRLPVERLSAIKPGSIVTLDNQAEQPVDLYVGGILVGRGEVQVLDDHFCVRVIELLAE